MAELDYGKEKMDPYRVREPSPSFELCPDELRVVAFE